MTCPICKRELKPSWEVSRSQWWAGVYTCTTCGDLKMSGTWPKRGGNRKVEHWHPACPKCGHEQVSLAAPGYQDFVCWACYRRFEVRGEHLIVTKRPGNGELLYMGETWQLDQAVMGG